MEGLRARRPEVLEEMLSAYGRQIHGVAYLVLHSTGDAEEVVMDTLLTAWDKAGSLRDPEALKPWLMRIATRHSLTKVRRSRPVDPLEDLDPGISDPSTSAADRLSLVAAVQALPPRMRAAIGLHYYADLDVDAVAGALGRSRNTVKTELRLALARLRAFLDPETPSPAAVEQTDAT